MSTRNRKDNVMLIECNFKFKPGQNLTTHAVRAMMKAELHFQRSVPMVLTVIECVSTTCYAGTQLNYNCRITHPNSMTVQTTPFPEFELTDDLSCVEPEKKDGE